MKKILLALVILLILALGLIVYTNLLIEHKSEDYLYSSIGEVEKHRVGLLLGTSPYMKGGGRNPFFRNRIEAAVRLFRRGKIDYILVSGDNAHLNYNEPRELRRALVKKGIPDDKIILDYAGFRTLDSVIRAHKVFGLDSFIVISQRFHNQRAVYLAREKGIAAIGYNADTPEMRWGLQLREVLAKTKAYWDIVFDVKPKFLGKPIPIE